MVQAGDRGRGHQPPGVGVRLVELGLQAGQRLALLLQRAAADEDRPVGQQHGVEVHPPQAQRRSLGVGRDGRGQVDDVDASVAWVLSGLPSGPPPMTITRWSWAGASSTLADWLRSSRRTGSPRVGPAPDRG